MAQDATGLPALNMITQPDGSTTYSLSLQILALMTAVSLLPSLVLGMTSFTRIIIVLSILRQAMGTQQTPPNQVLIAIALFLSLFIMTPTLTAVYDEAVNPYVDQKIAAEEAMSTGSTIMKSFMIRNTREKDLVMFSEMAGQGNFEDNADVPMTIVLPAFITSELKSAFQIGF
ncbi:MAG: flagellar type III secretion system pore protein FliP, partial [Pseudomonadota bacterium]|nr:flagellar type III secretion system pore protein FliP [Pseudomonadota bacterium]